MCLRLEDETVFLGRARVRLKSSEGRAVETEIPELLGEARIPEVRPGKYEVEVEAVGYEATPVRTDLEAGVGQRTLYVVMSPKAMHLDAGKAAPAETKEQPREEAPVTPRRGASSLLPAAKPKGSVARNYWMTNELETVIPPVEPSVACPTEKVL